MLEEINSQKQLVLDALNTFQPGKIYLMAHKQIVAKGFSYYHDRSVESFGWARDLSCLTARIRETRAVAVNIFFNKEGKLDFSCSSCNAGCAHIICALLTIKNLLQPELFRQADQDDDYRGALLTALSGMPSHPEGKAEKGEKPKGYAVCIEHKGAGRIELIMLKAGEAVTGNHAWTVPILRDLWLRPHAATHQKLTVLSHYLEQHENRFPIIVRAGGREMQVRFDPSLAYTTKTELNIERDTALVTKLAVPKDDEDDHPVIIGTIAYHPESKRLGLIRDIEGWFWWNDIFRIASIDETIDADFDYHAPSFQVPLNAFQRYHLSYPGPQRDAVLGRIALKADGAPAKLKPIEYEHRLCIASVEGAPDTLSLRIECLLGNVPLRPSERIFSFFDRLQNSLPQYLRAKKRRDALCSAFFDLAGVSSKAAAEKIVRAAVADADIDKQGMKREAREFLLNYYGEFSMNDEQLQFSSGAWTTVVPDRSKELLMYRSLYELFGWEAFENMPSYSEMLLPADRLQRRLPDLAGRLAAAGIGLILNNKPVRQARWELEFDAVRETNIDWFEIRPELRCNGKVVDRLTIGDNFYESGVLENEDCIHILDSSTREIMGRFDALRKGGKSQADRGRELVRIPRLQILDWIALRGKGVSVKLSPEDEGIVNRLLHFERIEEKPLPKALIAKLRPYQKEGYDWLSFLYEHRFGGCLADDMGLGKTVQAITLLGGIREGLVSSPLNGKHRPHLIVLPPSLLFNWEHELEKFYPDMKVTMYSGIERTADFSGSDVVLTTYGIVRRDIEKLKEIPFHVVIFDEAQTVKNIYAGMTGAARQLQAHFKLTMTGTPLENHIGEYYSIIDLSLPGLLGEYDDFRSLVKSETSPALDRIIRRTRPFVLRRTKENVLKELPPKTETDVYLELTDEQKALYTRTVEEVRSTIDSAYRDKTQAQAKIIALTAILKLRQICVSPQLLAPEMKGISPKVDFLIEQLHELIDENHSALVFSQFTSFLNIVEESLKARKIAYLRLDGSTPVVKRKGLVKDFQSNEGPPVFLLSLKAGGQGLNLTRASYVFHLDPWWNPAVETQASDRAHRIGQKQSVTVTRILMRHTIEEKMMELKKRKLALYQAIMDDSAGTTKGLSITKTDFEFLLGQ